MTIMLIIAAKMFTTGRIIFSSIFVIVFLIAMLISYKKDAKNNKIYYKNGALQIAIILIILIVLLSLSKYFIK